MTPPLVWALGTFVSIGLGATFMGDRLSRAAPRPAPDTVAASPANAGSEAERLLVVAGDRSGHFRVSTTIEGRHLFMLVDTGASIVTLSARDAEAVGIRPGPRDYVVPFSTANGTAFGARVRVRELRVGDISLRDVDAVVFPSGALGTSLLGMSFLRRLRGFEIAGNRLTLKG